MDGANRVLSNEVDFYGCVTSNYCEPKNDTYQSGTQQYETIGHHVFKSSAALSGAAVGNAGYMSNR